MTAAEIYEALGGRTVFQVEKVGMTELGVCAAESQGRVTGAAGSDPRRRDAGDAEPSSRSGNDGDDLAPPVTLWAHGGCGPYPAFFVVDDATASPPPRALDSTHKTHARDPGFLPRRLLGEQVRKGLPYGSLEAVMERLDLSREAVAEALQLPPRTVARRRRRLRLQLGESDRLFRLARIAAQATDVLGSTEKAARWLQRPNRALGGREPLRLLDTDAGARAVEAVLGRIEHGVFS